MSSVGSVYMSSIVNNNNNNNSSGTSRRGEGARLHRRLRLERNGRTRSRNDGKTNIGPEEDFGDDMLLKQDNAARLVFSNIDGFPGIPWNNSKAQALKTFLRWIDCDLMGGCEANLNWKRMPNHGRLGEWFRTENALKTSVAHNVHENFGRYQQGGTFMMAFGSMASRANEIGKDETGLGRWTWMKFQGREGHTTRIITAYQPCRTSRHRLGTVYSQHLRYFEQRGDFTCPRAAFVRDLGHLLCQWRQEGDRIVLMMDGNEDMTHGPVQRMLQQGLLQMREVVQERHPQLAKTGTHIRGSKPIDGIWATPDIQIEQGSWLAFFKGPGDHRIGVVDIPWDVLLGEDIFKVVRPQARRLSCGIPEAKRKYQELLDGFFQRHRILSRLHAVYSQAIGYLTPAQQREMNRIDRLRTEGMLYAEKRCRKLKMGDVDYSPEINDARQKRDLYRLILKQRNGRRISSRLIRRKAHSCGIPCPLSISPRDARKKFKEYDQLYRSLKPKADELREAFLVRRTRDPKVSDKAQKRASRMLRVERTRQAYRTLRWAQGITRASSVTKVEVADEHGNITTCEGQQAVEEAVMTENEARFRLTETTPPMTEPLRSELGYLGNTAAAAQIVNGTYVYPPAVNEYARAFLEQIHVPNPPPTVRTSITAEDYARYWKMACEYISSSLSGLHFGHWKAAVGIALLEEIHAIFTDIAFSCGFSPDRWQQGLSVMLEKKLGLILVHRLRAIGLLEADFNFGNKTYFGRRMMHSAETNNLLPAELFGSRRRHRAIDVALNRRLFADLMRQKRRNAAIASVDAHTCFDRIAHSIASLSCQRLALSIFPIVTMLLTLQRMKFYLRTAYGDSKTYYGGSGNGIPLQGICQGNGAGPATCIAVFAVCVLVLRQLGHTAKIRSAFTEALMELVGFIFVDDTDLLTVAPSATTSPEQVIESMQSAILAWQGVLNATGGALVPEKCCWWFIGFRWESGKWHYYTKATLPGDLYLKNEAGEMEAIGRKDPSEASTAVGVIQAMDGDMTEQVKALEEKATKWGTAIRKKKVPDRIAWQGLQTVLWPSLRYSLAATTITEEDGDFIIKKLYQQLLPSLGANRHFPRHWCFAPRRLQGFGLPHPAIERGIAQLSELLYHGPSPSVPGNFIRYSMEQAQLEVGSGTHLFLLDYDTYAPLLTENCWIASVWEFASKYNIRVLAEDPFIPKLQRTGDVFIMDVLIRSKKFDAKTLLSCNRCRVFLEAEFLSDIATGDGKRISSNAIRVTPDRDRKSKWEWPVEKPTRTDRDRWRQTLLHFATADYRLRPLYHLGDWIETPHKPILWRYDQASNTLFRHRHNAWHVYTESENQVTRRVTFSLSSIIRGEPPPSAEWATADCDNQNRAHLRGYAPAHIVPPPVYTSIAQLIASWTDTVALDPTSFPNDGLLLATGIAKGTALCASDGAYKPQHSKLGTAAWFAEDEPFGELFRGKCRTTGTRRVVNAHRSELQGLHTMLLAITAVCTIHDVKAGCITIGCDNLAGINLSKKSDVLVPVARKHADLVRGIRRLCADLSIELKFQHVYGHQDKHYHFESLDRLSQLNVLADELAGEYLEELIMEDPNPTANRSRVRKEGWRIFIGGDKVYSDPADPIRTEIAGDKLREILHEKDHIDRDVFWEIDWDAVDDSMNEFPQLFRRWVTKHVSGWCAVGKMQEICGYWDTSKCPCCPEPLETTTHLLICPHEGMKENWDRAADGLERWLISADTHPAIQDCIMHAVWERDLDTSFALFSSPEIEVAAQHQDEIGWRNFMEGKISVHWRDLQEAHYRNIGSSRTARRWAQNLVSSLLEMVHGQWKYRNNLVHERDAQGLLVAEGVELTAAITEQFELGKEGLHPRDRHYLDRPLAEILELPAREKRQWAQTIHLARTTHAEATETDIHRMRTFMENWVVRG